MSFDMKALAALSRIKLKTAEEGKLSEDLAKILNYVEELNELELSEIEPTSHPLDIVNVFREDAVQSAKDVALKVIEHDRKHGARVLLRHDDGDTLLVPDLPRGMDQHRLD